MDSLFLLSSMPPIGDIRRNARIHQLPRARQTRFSYGTQAPVYKHKPISGFNVGARLYPPIADSNENNDDDLPF